ncbi:MAG: hypothetical protein ACK4PH_23600 [Aquincola tertiaricarbonis]
MNAAFSARLRLLPALCLGALLLTACGGGGGEDDGTDAASSGDATATNGLAPLLGSYAVACESITQPSGEPAHESSQGSLVISATDDPGLAAVVIHAQAYEGASGDDSGARCDPSKLVLDLRISGHIRDLGRRKAIRAADNSTVNAKVVEFTYTGLRLSKGSFSGQLPSLNVTTQVAYVLDNGNLRLSSGPREADGVGARLTRRVGVRQ